MMNVIVGRSVAAMLAAMMLNPAPALAAGAEDGTARKLVVLGDRISAGAALEDASRSYAALTAAYFDADVTSFASDSCTTADLLVQLDDPQVQAALSEADMILFSVGMQDIMADFTAQLIEYQNQLGFETLDELYTASRSDLNVSDDDLSAYSTTLKRKLEANQETCADNIRAIGEKLSAYSNAQIICPNLYNSLNTIKGLEDMSIKRQMAYRSIMNPAGWADDYVNASYTELAENYGFVVIDAYGIFSGRAYKYTNQMQLDYSPNVQGHSRIAQEIIHRITNAVIGDLNNDGAVNASDAATVLEHAAVFGTDQKGTIRKEEWILADATRDGKADASDAAEILIYAAAVGIGETPVLGE